MPKYPLQQRHLNVHNPKIGAERRIFKVEAISYSDSISEKDLNLLEAAERTFQNTLKNYKPDYIRKLMRTDNAHNYLIYSTHNRVVATVTTILEHFVRVRNSEYFFVEMAMLGTWGSLQGLRYGSKLWEFVKCRWAGVVVCVIVDADRGAKNVYRGWGFQDMNIVNPPVPPTQIRKVINKAKGADLMFYVFTDADIEAATNKSEISDFEDDNENEENPDNDLLLEDNNDNDNEIEDEGGSSSSKFRSRPQSNVYPSKLIKSIMQPFTNVSKSQNGPRLIISQTRPKNFESRTDPNLFGSQPYKNLNKIRPVLNTSVSQPIPGSSDMKVQRTLIRHHQSSSEDEEDEENKEVDPYVFNPSSRLFRGGHLPRKYRRMG